MAVASMGAILQLERFIRSVFKVKDDCSSRMEQTSGRVELEPSSALAPRSRADAGQSGRLGNSPAGVEHSEGSVVEVVNVRVGPVEAERLIGSLDGISAGETGGTVGDAGQLSSSDFPPSFTDQVHPTGNSAGADHHCVGDAAVSAIDRQHLAAQTRTPGESALFRLVAKCQGIRHGIGNIAGQLAAACVRLFGPVGGPNGLSAGPEEKNEDRRHHPRR